jgi:hypothetical protein
MKTVTLEGTRWNYEAPRRRVIWPPDGWAWRAAYSAGKPAWRRPGQRTASSAPADPAKAASDITIGKSLTTALCSSPNSVVVETAVADEERELTRQGVSPSTAEADKPRRFSSRRNACRTRSRR